MQRAVVEFTGQYIQHLLVTGGGSSDSQPRSELRMNIGREKKVVVAVLLVQTQRMCAFEQEHCK